MSMQRYPTQAMYPYIGGEAFRIEKGQIGPVPFYYFQ